MDEKKVAAQNVKEAYENVINHPYRAKGADRELHASSYALALLKMTSASMKDAWVSLGMFYNPMRSSMSDVCVWMCKSLLNPERSQFIEACIVAVQVQVATGELKNTYSYYEGVSPVTTDIIPRFGVWDVHPKKGAVLRLTKEQLEKAVEAFANKYAGRYTYWVWEDMEIYLKRRLERKDWYEAPVLSKVS